MRKRIIFALITLTLTVFDAHAMTDADCTTEYNGTGTCPAGCYMNSTSCVACQTGHMCTGNGTQQECPAGQYQDQPGQGTCKQCSGNTYTSTTNQTDCKDIPSNSTVKSDHTGFQCNAGYYSSDQNTCTQCGVGTYKTEPGNAPGLCLSCASFRPNTTTNGTGKTQQNDCVCAKNYYLETDNNCQPFQNGTCPSVGNDITRCDCNSGHAKTSDNKCSNNCSDLFQGQQKCSDGDRRDCTVSGTYNNGSDGYTSCICTATYNHAGTIGTQICIHTDNDNSNNWTWGRTGDITGCQEGHCIQDGTNQCKKAKPGYYSAASEQQCHQCPTGTYQDEEGQSTCEKCDAGTYAEENGQTSCTPCPKGHYQTQQGKSTCEQCPDYMITDNTGSKTPDACFFGGQDKDNNNNYKFTFSDNNGTFTIVNKWTYKNSTITLEQQQ